MEKHFSTFYMFSFSPPAQECRSLGTVEGFLTRRLQPSARIIGTLGAVSLFFVAIWALGSPAIGDSSVVLPNAFLVAHGDFSCAFSTSITGGNAAPLTAVLLGLALVISRVSFAAPFPGPSALGPHCATAIQAVNSWQSAHATALHQVLWVAAGVWLVVAFGVWRVIVVAGYGGTVRELFSLYVVALLPTAWMSLSSLFHPQDLMAAGFVFAAMASRYRDNYVTAGILLALSFLSQQYALLPALALIVMAPSLRQALKLLASFGVTVIALGGVFLVSFGSETLRALTTGTATTFLRTDSLFAEIGLSNTQALYVARVAPFVLTAAFCWWWRQRKLSTDLAGIMLVVCAALASRLLVEENIFGYYFFPLTLGLTLFDVITQKLRLTTVLLVAGTVLAFYPFPFGNDPLRWIAMWKWQCILLPLVFFAIIIRSSEFQTESTTP